MKTCGWHLLKNPELIRPGGRRRRVTVFFVDIAGFTPIAEHLPAEETATILHTLLNAFTIMDINTDIQNIIKGLVLLGAIILDNFLHPRDEETARQGD